MFGNRLLKIIKQIIIISLLLSEKRDVIEVEESDFKKKYNETRRTYLVFSITELRKAFKKALLITKQKIIHRHRNLL